MPTLYAEPLGSDRFKVLLPGDIPAADVPGDFLYPLLSNKEPVANAYIVSRQQLPLLTGSMGIDRVEPFSGLLSFLNDGETREQTKELMRAGGQLSGEAAEFLAEMVPAMLNRTPAGQVAGVVGRATLSTLGRKARKEHEARVAAAQERYKKEIAENIQIAEKNTGRLRTHERRTEHIQPKSVEGAKKLDEAKRVRREHLKEEFRVFNERRKEIDNRHWKQQEQLAKEKGPSWRDVGAEYRNARGVQNLSETRAHARFSDVVLQADGNEKKQARDLAMGMSEERRAQLHKELALKYGDPK